MGARETRLGCLRTGRLVPILLCLAALVGPAFPNTDYTTPSPPNKLALVIGNSDYSHLADLPSAREDAENISALLASLGFEVHTHHDVKDFRQFEDDILPRFRKRISEGDFVLFFYSGHGFAHGPHNLLAYAEHPLRLPESRVAIEALSVEALEDNLSERQPGVLVFLLDACRSIGDFVMKDRSGREVTPKGMAAPQRSTANAVNVLSGYATRPGSIAEASTADGEMSVFSKAIADYLDERDKSFTTIFTSARTDVTLMTDDGQVPGLHNYSSTDPYLDPPDSIVEQEREAWMSALGQQDHLEVARFLKLNSVGHFAHAARQWLANNPNLANAPRYTRISPAAVERAWYPMLTGERYAVTGLTSGLAFERALAGSATETLARFQPPEIGVLPADGGGAAGFDVTMMASLVESIQEHGSVIATKSMRARTAPSLAADPVPIAPRTRIDVPSAGRNIYTSGAPIVSREEGETIGWLQARTPDARPIYLPVAAGSLQPVRLGRALLEVSAPPRNAGIASLVDPAAITDALGTLRRNGNSVTWVSLSTASSGDGLEDDRRKARLANALYILKQNGIDGRRITSVDGATDYSGDGVRLRFFGN